MNGSSHNARRAGEIPMYRKITTIVTTRSRDERLKGASAVEAKWKAEREQHTPVSAAENKEARGSSRCPAIQDTDDAPRFSQRRLCFSEPELTSVTTQDTGKALRRTFVGMEQLLIPSWLIPFINALSVKSTLEVPSHSRCWTIHFSSEFK